jgi:hypothetical protein
LGMREQRLGLGPATTAAVESSGKATTGRHGSQLLPAMK